MNWGKGLALALIMFAGMMAWFVVMAARDPELLVTEQYYEQELVYQARIDDTERANALSTLVGFHADVDLVRLTFPPEFNGRRIMGELTLLRPHGLQGDRLVAVVSDTNGVFEAKDLDLIPGRYNALLQWSADGSTYYSETKLVVP